MEKVTPMLRSIRGRGDESLETPGEHETSFISLGS